MMTRRVALVGLLAALLSGYSPAAYPASPEDVLVVVNDNSSESLELGTYYQSARNIPAQNICHIACTTSETIPQAAYYADIETPAVQHVQANGLSVNFVVLTRGIPLKISDWTHRSVDCLMTLANSPLISSCYNPYYEATEPFQSAAYDNVWLVTRLDGYTVDDARALVDRSLFATSPGPLGTFLFDMDPGRDYGFYKILNDRMSTTSAALEDAGFTTLLDQTTTFVGNQSNLMGYVSWGSNDGNYSRGAYQSNSFRPGAIAETYVSSSARTLHDPNDPGQSLIADLVEQGVTGVSGYIEEPYTSGLTNVEILVTHYTTGYTLAESFYASLVYLGWEAVILGDPLCAPYVDGALPVELSSFRVLPRRDGSIALSWTTQSEVNTLGFHLYRSSSAEGDYIRLTGDLIRGAGNTSTAQEYLFVDHAVRPGRAYYYLLEEVEFTGRTQRHGPFRGVALPSGIQPRRWGRVKAQF